ncbi:MAG: cell division protein SepF [Ruminococcaceae bacterium]|nr:cell division protein SepF [Oscillospiraceae bacterium]
MGFFDELKNLARPYDEDEDEYIDDPDVVEETEAAEKPRPNPFASFVSGASGAASSAPAPERSAPASPLRPLRSRESNVVSIGNVATGQMQVILVKPERFETAAEIADHLRSKHAVLMNLETTPKDVTRRLVDFLSGVAYAMDGKVKKIAANTYIITPPNVNLMGDLMDELESSGMYF